MPDATHPNRIGVMKQHGGPWRCAYCGRATVQTYRCSNFDCARDLTGVDLDAI